MKKLTRIERRIIKAMNIAHIAAYIVAAIGFVTMFIGCSRFNEDMITFGETVRQMGIGLIVLLAAMFINDKIEKLHDDFCYQLGIFDHIGYKRMSHTYVYRQSQRDLDIQAERQRKKDAAARCRKNSAYWDEYFKKGGHRILPQPEGSAVPDTEDGLQVIHIQ